MNQNKQKTHNLKQQVRTALAGLFGVYVLTKSTHSTHSTSTLSSSSVPKKVDKIYPVSRFMFNLKNKTSALLSKVVLLAVTTLVVPSSAVVLFLDRPMQRFKRLIRKYYSNYFNFEKA